MGLFDKLKKNVSSAVKDAVSDSFGDTINELTSSFKNVRSIVDEIRSEGASMLGTNSLTNSLANSLTGLKQPMTKPGQTMTPKQSTPEATVFKAEDLLKVGKIISDDATADSDGDVRASFPADDKFNITRTVWLMLGPERLTVQMAMHSPCDNGKSRRALDSMSLGAGVSADVSDDGVVRFNYRIVVDKNSDLAAVSYKTMQAVTLLGKHTADFCRAAGHDYVNRKLRMTTDVLVDLLKKNGVREYEVDSDGDVRADYSKAQDQSFRWFVWYMISDDEIMIDSGSTEIADCVDIRQVVDFVNNNDSCRGIVTAKITDKGSLRLKAAIPYGDEKAFVDKWVDVDSTLNVIWHTVYLVGKEQEKNLRREAERRTAAESERQARYDNDDDDDDDEYRTETSGRRDSSASAERERKAEEKRRKEEAKRRKAEKIARLQSRIKDAEGNLVTYYNNLELFKQNPSHNADKIKGTKAEIARRKAVIKGYKDEIARIRREE